MKADKEKLNILHLLIDTIKSRILFHDLISYNITDDGILRNDLLAKAFLVKQEEKN